MKEMLIPLRANPDNNFRLEVDVTNTDNLIVYGFEIKNGVLHVAVQKYENEDDIFVEELDEEEDIQDVVELFR